LTSVLFEHKQNLLELLCSLLKQVHPYKLCIWELFFVACSMQQSPKLSLKSLNIKTENGAHGTLLCF